MSGSSAEPVCCCHDGRKMKWYIPIERQPHTVMSTTSTFDSTVCTLRSAPARGFSQGAGRGGGLSEGWGCAQAGHAEE